MKQHLLKSDIAQKLQNDILSLQGYTTPIGSRKIDFGLGPIGESFPNGVFPTGAVHEFLSDGAEDAAATSGFMACLVGRLLQQGGACLWIGIKRAIFPPALMQFGIEPHRVIFVDLLKEQDVLWAIEESLKCDAVAAVVGELKEITLTESRRLQLAVESSKVTGFLHRFHPRSANTLACASRWKLRRWPVSWKPACPE